MNYNKALVNVKAFTNNDSNIEKIINICKLEPICGSWQVWTDNYGYNLIIRKNICVRKSKNQEFKTKDIFLKASIDRLSNESKWVIIIFMKDKNGYSCLMGLLSKDDRFRVAHYSNNEWQENVSPLSLGIRTLKLIVSNLNVEDYKVLTSLRYINIPYEGSFNKAWLGIWPPSNNMKLDILLTNKEFGEKILKDSGVL